MTAMMLSEKVIVVTDASRGLGRAITSECARQGAIVGVNYHFSGSAARDLVAEDPRRLRLAPFDVRDPAAVSAAIADLVRDTGRIDGWVNNAGVFRPGLLAKTDNSDIQQQVETNLVGPIVCTRAVLPHMVERRTGVVLNVGSVAAVRATAGQAVYAATKAGLEGLTRAVAVECTATGVRVVCVRPGHFESDMLNAALPKLGPSSSRAFRPAGSAGRRS